MLMHYKIGQKAKLLPFAAKGFGAGWHVHSNKHMPHATVEYLCWNDSSSLPLYLSLSLFDRA